MHKSEKPRKAQATYIKKKSAPGQGSELPQKQNQKRNILRADSGKDKDF